MTYQLDYSENVEVNGSIQNIRVRAAKKGLPVILFLHGGPGVCDRHNILRDHSDLAEDFTLVCWDQRGSGKSYTPDIKKSVPKVADYVDDVEFMLEYLTGKFGVRKVAMVGHSWGSIIGVLAAARRPDLLFAYVGEGQFVDGDRNEEGSYRFCLEEAKRRGDKKALAALEKGAPVDGVYPDNKSMMTQRDCLSRYGGAIHGGKQGLVKGLLMPLLKTKEYSLADIVKYAPGRDLPHRRDVAGCGRSAFERDKEPRRPRCHHAGQTRLQHPPPRSRRNGSTPFPLPRRSGCGSKTLPILPTSKSPRSGAPCSKRSFPRLS